MTRTHLLTALSLSAGLAAASAARAEEAISTARVQAPAAAVSTASAPATAATDDTATQIDAWIRKAPPVSLDDEGPDGVVSGETPRKVHGEVGVTVGSGGYRSAYAITVMPIGQTGTLALAVSETRGGRHGGFGGPYGYGFGGTRRSLAVDLALGQPTQTRCPEIPSGPVAFDDHAGPDLYRSGLYRAECGARADGRPD